MDPYELRAPGILLATPTEDDIERITAICQDPDVQAWTTIPSPYSRNDATFFVRDWVRTGWSSGRETTWAVRDPETREVLGMIGISRSHTHGGEVGYWMAPEARGRGLMTAALRLVAEHALDPEGLNLSHVIWWAYLGNWASRRVAWSAGFRVEGTVRGGQPQRSTRRDSWVGTLARGDAVRPATPWYRTPEETVDRLRLRALTAADVERVVQGVTDPVTRRWLSGLPCPYGPAEAAAFLEDSRTAAADGRGVDVAVADPDDDRLLGCVGVRDEQDRPGTGFSSLGYWVHPDERGRGVATDAARAVARWALRPTAEGGMGRQRIRLSHAVGNEASGRVAVRAGFTRTHTERASLLLDEGPVDRVCYELAP